MRGRGDGPGHGTGRWLVAASLPVGLLISALWIWQGSQAAYTATTSNPGNGFSAGTVDLADDDNGSAMFSVAGLQPGDTGRRCIRISYSGSLRARVKVFVAPGALTGSGLSAYLDLTIEEGSGAGFGSCAGFTPTATVQNDTLAAFANASTSAATGVGTFTPTGTGQSQDYRFTYTLRNDDAAQGRTSQVAFTWVATSF